MIPPIGPETENLPPGEHDATWEELQDHFGGSERRRSLLSGLHAALGILGAAGIPRVYIDGSFISAKEEPGDFDACWDYDEQTDFGALDPVFFDFASGRIRQKVRFGGEFFPAEAIADGIGTPCRLFFQRDKYTGQPKGVVVINLRKEDK